MERVREAAARTWGEPVRVFRLDSPYLRYQVRGRRRDGVRRQTKDRSGCLGLVSVVLDIPQAAAEVVVTLLGRMLMWPLRDTVRGKEDSGGVRFADAFRHGAQYLVWSPSRTALVTPRPDGGLHHAWTATGADRPELRLPRRLRWPDGSWLRLAVLQSDRTRYREEQAAAAR
ncbi:hypothetical protein [Crossiella sp. CA198]|uniref:hypothetical protein n=1 Tax=Crossiella sp. CA198 TaxID=3455607 RepID=UPI003F8D25EB